MSKKGLSKEKINDIKEMSVNGVLPQDIAVALNIAVSTVHHHKSIMKSEGMSFPNYRGQRPRGAANDASWSKGKLPTLIVNGTKILITGKPLVIKISPDTIEVDYQTTN
jgi:hypothetical protein